MDFESDILPLVDGNRDRFIDLMRERDFPWAKLVDFFENPANYEMEKEEYDDLRYDIRWYFSVRQTTPGFVFNESSWSHAAKLGLVDEARFILDHCAIDYYRVHKLSATRFPSEKVAMMTFLNMSLSESAFRGHAGFVRTIGDQYGDDWDKDFRPKSMHPWSFVLGWAKIGERRAERHDENTGQFAEIEDYCTTHGGLHDEGDELAKKLERPMEYYLSINLKTEDQDDELEWEEFDPCEQIAELFAFMDNVVKN